MFSSPHSSSRNMLQYSFQTLKNLNKIDQALVPFLLYCSPEAFHSVRSVSALREQGVEHVPIDI
jgi:tryptophan synthase alpha subunit